MAIYLDYNATAPLRPEAIEKMQEILALPSNPSAVHSFGRAAKKHLEDARQIIADALSAFTDEVIFMASGTEANATVLNGFPDRRILVSAIEHSSILKSCADATLVPVTSDGVIDLAALEKYLAENAKPALVSLMLANNETGVIQPVGEAAAICKKYQALLHCDAVQAFGKIPVDFGQLSADILSLGAHKCGGPVGAAAMVIRRNLPFQPLLKGGKQESNRRASTSNVAACAGFGVAVQKFDLDQMKTLRGWLDNMEAETGAHVFGKSAPRLPNTSALGMPGVASETQMIDFDLNGFAVSAGSACTSGRTEISSVLKAMNVPEALAACFIRVSAGWGTKEADIKAFAHAWKQTNSRLTKKAISA
jgi:cysteine desulfurase